MIVFRFVSRINDKLNNSVTLCRDRSRVGWIFSTVRRKKKKKTNDYPVTISMVEHCTLPFDRVLFQVFSPHRTS